MKTTNYPLSEAAVKERDLLNDGKVSIIYLIVWIWSIPLVTLIAT